MTTDHSNASLPSSWVHARLGELGSWVGGGTPSKANASFWTNGNIPWISPKDMKVFRLRSSQDCITAAAVINSTATLLPSGAVLVVTRSGILQHTLPVSVSQVSATVNQDLKAMVPYPGIDSTYVAYALKARERDILESCSKDGTTVQSIDSARLYAFSIPVAPLNEQHRIVAEIETQLTRLDAAVASLERTRANLKRYRPAVLKAACEGSLVPTEAELAQAEGREYETADVLIARLAEDATKRSKQRRQERRDTSNLLANLPNGWSSAPLPKIGDLSRGKSKHRPRNDPKLLNGKYPFIQTGDVRNASGVIRAYSGTYNEFGLAQSRLWPAGTLCITIAANIAETGILGFDACFPDSVVGFRQSNSTVVKFVELFLRTAREELDRYASATAQKNINLDTLSNVLVPLPPLAEQERIVAEVERRFSVLDEMEQTVAHGLKRAARLRQAILHKAFTGQLVPQDPGDEPASVLLDRIRAERAAQANGKPTRKPRKRAVGQLAMMEAQDQ